MKGKVIEIFRSVQGEGLYAGTLQVFVRLFECNMHCVWCDTPHSIGDTTRKYHEMDPEEVVAGVSELCQGSDFVSVTGGEPLVQVDFLKELLPQLKAKGFKIYLDTNGTLPLALRGIVDAVDIIAMDIKLPSSTQCRSFWAEHEEFLKIARRREVFIKAVISGNTESSEVLKSAELVAQVDPAIPFILQPNSFEMHNGAVQKCVQYQNDCLKYLNNVRILPQMHKFLKVR